jgi:hypothetical protein
MRPWSSTATIGSGIDLVDLADEAEILTVLGTAGTDQQGGTVLAAHPHRLAAEPVDATHQVGADLAGEHHLHHLHGGFVGDPQPVDELRLDAEPLLPRGDLGTAAVDQHGAHADEAEQHHVLEKGVDVLPHRRAAELDHQGVAGEAPDVGERLDEHLGPPDPLLHGLDVGGHGISVLMSCTPH